MLPITVSLINQQPFHLCHQVPKLLSRTRFWVHQGSGIKSPKSTSYKSFKPTRERKVESLLLFMNTCQACASNEPKSFQASPFTLKGTNHLRQLKSTVGYCTSLDFVHHKMDGHMQVNIKMEGIYKSQKYLDNHMHPSYDYR